MAVAFLLIALNVTVKGTARAWYLSRTVLTNPDRLTVSYPGDHVRVLPENSAPVGRLSAVMLTMSLSGSAAMMAMEMDSPSLIWTLFTGVMAGFLSLSATLMNHSCIAVEKPSAT